MGIINCENISFSYEKNKVIEDISFEINKNENVGIIGANGSGKTTLFKLILGIENVDKGIITIDDLEVKKANLSKIRSKMGYLFQDSDNQLFMNSVEDEVSFALYNYGMDENEISNRVESTLEKLDIKELKERKIIKLSGGEKKLVAIASILALEPEILLLDEPTNALDPKYRRRIIKLLNEIKCTKIIASHDLDMISKTCKKVILLHKGKIVKMGNMQEILSNEVELRKYDL